MANQNRGLLLFLSLVLAIVLVGVVLLIGSPATYANYAQLFSTERTPQLVVETKSERLEAVMACLPKQLANSSDLDFKARLKQAMTEMSNDQLERVFDLTDNPKLSEAEIQFKNCLREKGFTTETNY
ncbi:MAG: hypothetical protein WA919_20055 [Coleofasciculaceae cyanobacterium]